MNPIPLSSQLIYSHVMVDSPVNEYIDSKTVPTHNPIVNSIQPVQFTSVSYSGIDIRQLIINKFGPTASTALCIASHESGLRSDASHLNANGTWDVGVFQINDVHGISWNQRLDPVFNVNYAYILSGAGYNWGAWTTKRFCV